MDHGRHNAGGPSHGGGGYLTANGGHATSPLAESPGVPIPGGWPSGSGSGSGQYGSGENVGWKGTHEGDGTSFSPPNRSPHLVPQSGSSQFSRLPRIMTTTDDKDGPRSAPALPPPQMNAVRGVSPNRASSVPDPRERPPIEHAGSSLKNSPSMTGLATSNGPPVLATPYYSQKDAHLQFPTPQLPVPPRRSSSHLAGNSPTEPRSAAQFSSSPNSTGSHSNGHGALQAPQGSTEGRSRSGTERSERSERSGRTRGEPTYCGQCEQTVQGQFVRAMGKVYHLNCFRCKDCSKVVAQKFFPVEDGEGMYPLCERDYFARLDLICAKCDQALRSSYITACGEKYHVEHFTCSECDVVFGPNDSYYEHGSKVYCHFHYSTRFAVKCVGCETAILKQFVEMNRNGKDECWHPECYMISKFWNVRLASKNFSTPANSAVSSAISLEMTPTQGMTIASATGSPEKAPEMTPEELKERQESMELKVLQIWHVLSGYEESSAALIGEMLRAVNGRDLLDIVLLAERFILHVEALFAVIDDLEAQFAQAGMKGMSHAREAKQLCRKLVNLFSTMSQISPLPSSAQPTNQDLYNLITQLAHYLKILIRIALTGGIKLEREQGNSGAMINTLARLNLLSMDGGDPTLSKRGDYPEVGEMTPQDGATTPGSSAGDEEQLKKAIDALPRRPRGFLPSTQSIAYGYRSLAPEVTNETTLRGPQGEDFVPPEGCTTCTQAIEEDCIRTGMFNRWHSPCVTCVTCGDRAVPLPVEESDDGQPKYRDDGSVIIAPKPKRPPPRTSEFSFLQPDFTIYCDLHRIPGTEKGFEPVSRLEQYAFLLHIALRRLYVHFRLNHDLPSVRDKVLDESHPQPDIKRVKSIVTLDRKLSSTARLPQRSMVVESPAGRIAKEDGRIVSARSHDGPPDTETIVEDEAPQSATVDVIRPPFARNNTNVMIVNENNDLPPEIVEQMQTHHLMQEDDALTLGDIPLLADQSMRHRSPPSKPLLANLNHLQSLILKHFALLSLQKSGLGHLIELDEVLELMDMRKSQWWNKIFKGNAKDKQKKKGVFNVPLEVLVERTGSDSVQGASNSTLRVPEFIEEIIATMRQMDMAIEGIFRKNGNIRRLQQISEALDKDSTNVNLSEENPVQLAALLKRFLRELPDPLLTFKLHKLFCAAASYQAVEERQRCLHLLICLLPRYNRDTMEVLFVFLKWVASFSYKDEETGSRMDMPNLATVICPSILYAKGTNAARDESFIAITAIQDMLENQDEYFTVPNELLFVINENIYNIFAKDLDLPPKEIHRHCSKYMQARGPSTRLPTSASGPIRDQPRPPLSTASSAVPPPSASQARYDDAPPVQYHEQGGSSQGVSIISRHAPSNAVPQSPYRGASLASPIPPNLGASNPPHPASLPHHPALQNGPRPNSWFLATHGSQQNLQAIPSNGSALSPTATMSSGHGHGQPFKGPFAGAGNGSRTSSRGSAPGSPGPEGRRGSVQLERESAGRRTPLQ